MYLNNDFCTLEWNEEKKAIQLIWKKMARNDDFKLVMQKMAELINEKKATKWLADMSDAGVIAQEDQAWFQKEIGPKILSVKKIAMILPKSIITKMSLDRGMNESNQSGLDAKYFSDREEAWEWLK